jgi:glycosyltransferase involved in cell wall biosynthesis
VRILYHHRTWAADGQEIHIRAMQQAFIAEGNEVREVALAPKGAGRAVSRTREPIGGVRQGFFRHATSLPLLLREAAEYAYTPVGRRRLITAGRGFAADFIYERYAFANAAGVRAARHLGIPLVLEVNSPLSEELAGTRGLAMPSLARRVERSIFSSAHLVCTVSEQLRNIVVGLGAAPENTIVIPNGVDLERYPYPPNRETRTGGREAILGRTTIDARTQPVLAGFVGYFRAWHRLDLLLHAMARVADDVLHLVVVGDGSGAAELRQLADTLGIGERVHWLGSRTPESIPDLLTAFDFAVMPGITPYACPLKLIEYLAAGLPAVVPDQANIRELVTDRESGILFEPESTNALSAALAHLTSDDGLRRRLGSSARQTVERRDLTWSGNARRVVREVEPLLQGGSSNRPSAGSGR